MTRFAVYKSRVGCAPAAVPCMVVGVEVTSSGINGDQAAEGAVVTVEITQPDGTAVEVQGSANNFGNAKITYPLTQRGTYTAAVVDIQYQGAAYDPSANTAEPTSSVTY